MKRPDIIPDREQLSQVFDVPVYGFFQAPSDVEFRGVTEQGRRLADACQAVGDVSGAGRAVDRFDSADLRIAGGQKFPQKSEQLIQRCLFAAGDVVDLVDRGRIFCEK